MKSLHLEKAFEHLYCSVGMGTEEEVVSNIQAKKALVSRLWELELPDQDQLRTLSTVYIASGTDVHLPLCLGSRSIDLVDPCFYYPENILKVVDSIEELTEEKVKAQLGPRPTFEFYFDFGQGTEQVDVRCLARVYRNTSKANCFLSDRKSEVMTLCYEYAASYYGRHIKEVDDYTEEGNVGFLISFNSFGNYFDRDQSTIDRLVSGGLLVNTVPFECLEMSQEAYAACRVIMGHDPAQYHTLVLPHYQAAGRFEPVDLHLPTHPTFFISCLRRL